MSVVGTLLGLVLPLFLIVMVVRAVLDWTGVLGVGDVGWAARLWRLSHTLTEPALSPVRRDLKPVRVGSLRLDLTFTVVFIAALVLRSVLISLSAFGPPLCQASPRHVFHLGCISYSADKPGCMTSTQEPGPATRPIDGATVLITGANRGPGARFVAAL
jgi:YggT family protein